MFEPGNRYYSALPNRIKPEALKAAKECLEASADPESEIVAMLEQGWREQMVAGVAMLVGGASARTVQAMWDALDADSWTVSQLVVLLSVLDPDALDKMKKRILLGCPVKLRGQENLDPLTRHVLHGQAPVYRFSNKAWSAICWRLFLAEPQWLLDRFSADEVWQRMLEPYGYEGAEIADNWHRELAETRPDLNLPRPLEKGDRSANVAIAVHWRTAEKRETYQCPKATLEILFGEEYNPPALIYPFLKDGLDQGDRCFDFTPEAMLSRHSRVPVSPGVRTAILGYVRLDCASDVGVLDLGSRGPELWLVRMGDTLRLRHRKTPRKLEGRIELTRERLEHAHTDAICYGAKDTGEMGGGAAMAVYQSCGPEVLKAARRALSETSRQVGEVVFTPAYGHECTVYVGHIISIKTGTSQGDWCPEPERLADGVYNALKTLPKRARTVAFSCLATGEGRAQPPEIARLMIGAVKRFFRENPESEIQVLFSLPDFEDYQAFQKAL